MPNDIAQGTSSGTRAARCAAFVRPYLSGKTSLLESLLHATDAISRKGSIKEGNTVGDNSPEARARSSRVCVGGGAEARADRGGGGEACRCRGEGEDAREGERGDGGEEEEERAV